MALRGIKVLELAGLAPAPFCGMILADFGATVIRIDRVKSAADLDVLSNGKQSVAIDLKSENGRDIFKKLSKTSDVLIEPFRCGVMESLGLGPDILLGENPKLIYARLTGFGQKGCYKKRAGHDIDYVAMSGLLSLFGRDGQKPSFPVNFAADFAGGGLMCAMGILLALFERTNSAKGQVVDNSMVEGTAYAGSWLFRSQNLPIWGNARGSNVLDSGSHFYDVYETKDGKYMSVGAMEPHFYETLLQKLEIKSDDLSQYDFKEGKELFEKIFQEKTQEEWCKIFDEVDACVFPVLSLEEATKHRHNVESNTFARDSESTIIPRPAPILSRTPGVSKGTEKRPKLGEHTFTIMKTLGYTDEEIIKLGKEGIIKFIDSKL